jgi:hypothetical protein
VVRIHHQTSFIIHQSSDEIQCRYFPIRDNSQKTSDTTTLSRIDVPSGM